VARKYQSPGSERTAAETSALYFKTAAPHLTGLRLPPRIRKVPTLRRPVPIKMVPAESRAVNIRHIAQNLGAAVTKTQPVRNQRV
jgi:hypothetical protein